RPNPWVKSAEPFLSRYRPHSDVASRTRGNRGTAASSTSGTAFLHVRPVNANARRPGATPEEASELADSGKTFHVNAELSGTDGAADSTPRNMEIQAPSFHSICALIKRASYVNLPAPSGEAASFEMPWRGA